MNGFNIEFDWEDPVGARGEELRATWASLAIVINDQPVTELQDRQTRSVRSRIYLPLFPLAEWFVNNWWFLQSESEHLDSSEDLAFDRRHNIRWAREGFVLPSLRFVTLGGNIAAGWKPLEIYNAGITFSRSGHCVVNAVDFRETIRNFVNAVVTRLDDFGIAGTSLHNDWASIQNADSDEQDFCQAVARLGKDPYVDDPALEASVLSVAGRIRDELLADFLSLATIDELSSQADALEHISNSIASDCLEIDVLASVRHHAPQFSQRNSPWETGYHFATGLRTAINGHPWKSRSLEELAEKLSIDQLDRSLLPESGKCRFLDALVGLNERGNPKFLIEKKRPDSRQFAFCRAMFENLTSPGKFGAVSGLRTDRQQMSRAFAAELLAPHDGLKQDISGSVVGEEEIAQLSEAYGVSTRVIEHQIRNHRLASILS